MNRSSSSMPLWQTAGLTLIRMTLAIFMIYHGWEVFSKSDMDKYLQWDMFKNSSGKILVYMGKGAEFVGGILLFFGLFTRIAAVILIGTMSYITFFVGKGRIWLPDEQYPFLFVLLAMVFLFIGGGRWSLDHLIFKKQN